MSASKRAKTGPSPEEELICPITQELLVEPMMAEDGTLYEKYAIEQYFQHELKLKKHGDSAELQVKSPYKGMMMGQKLIPAPQIKNLIEKLIEQGSISGNVADAWKEKMLEKKAMNDLLKKAEEGDFQAIEKVADNFYEGKDGFPKDIVQAKFWYWKATLKGSVKGQVQYGILGAGGMQNFVKQSKTSCRSYRFVLNAACLGSDLAAFLMGMNKVSHGYTAEAIEWFKKSLDDNECPHKMMSDKEREFSRMQLDFWEQESSE